MPRPLLLLVDDDADVIDAGTALFGQHGFEVTTTNDGAQAVQAVMRRAPDVIVLDLLMPRFSGWDVYDWLSTSPFRDIPIVIWTAAGLRTGAVGNVPIVAKDAPPLAILETVRAVLA